MKKRIGACLLTIALLLCALAGCADSPQSAPSGESASDGTQSASAPSDISSTSSQTPAEVSSSQEEQSASAAPRTEFRIASLKGPTTMGLVKLMRDAEDGAARHDYTVNMYGTADEIAPQLIQGQLDVALIPCNLASTLYNKMEGGVELLAVNTLGVLYIVTTGEGIESAADLAGKTILTTGKGTTPEYVLDYVLTQNGLVPGEDVTVEYKSEAAEVLAAMQTSSGYPIAMLPQPYVTTAQMQMENLRVALDMTEEWAKVAPDSQLVTGVAVVRREFAEQNPDALAEFLEDYAASTQYVTEHVDEAAALCASYGIVPKEEIAKKALPACNITCLTGIEMKQAVSGYLRVLYDRNPKAVGGALPDDAFYYGA